MHRVFNFTCSLGKRSADLAALVFVALLALSSLGSGNRLSDYSSKHDRFIADYSRANTAYLFPALSLEEIIRRFSDGRMDPAERRLFAYRLC